MGSILKLIDLIKEKGKIVLKAYVDAGDGKGVYICNYIYGDIFVNKKKVSEENFKLLVSKLNKYIVTEYMEQSDYSSKFYLDSLNTLRIVTMEDPETREVFIPIVIHRIGTKQSKTVDNWSKGGLSALIDIDSEILGKAISKPINN